MYVLNQAAIIWVLPVIIIDPAEAGPPCPLGFSKKNVFFFSCPQPLVVTLRT